MINQNEFYKRQLNVDFIGTSGQTKLAFAKVLIIGAGGLGHPLAQILTGSGVGTIAICDFDEVDYTNLHRQILFNPDDVGQPKAIVLANKLSQQNPNISVVAINERFNKQNSAHIISPFDYIVDCTDNFSTKFLIHDIAFKHKKKLFMASVGQWEGLLHTFDFTTNTDPCFRCLYPTIPEAECTTNCADNGVMSSTTFIFGSFLANEIIKNILNIPTHLSGKSFVFNLLTLDNYKLNWEKNMDCNLCSTNDHKSYNDDLLELDFTAINPSDFIFFDVTINEPHKDLFNTSDKYIFVCNKGVKSLNFTKKFRELGFNNIWSLAGGRKTIVYDIV